MTNAKISPPVDAQASVKISPDGLQAFIRISPPENGGGALAYYSLKNLLELNKVVFGLDDDTLQFLGGGQPVYDTDFVIAHGIPCEDGIDSKLVYHIETDRKMKPREREDGSVDFKDLGLIQEVKQGQLLCEKIAALPGKPGTSVTGKPLPQVPGRDIELPAGQNTAVSDDKLRLYAAMDGLVSIVGDEINVFNMFTVNGDASLETGNISFSGSVHVSGDVLSDFMIQAAGDIIVDGVVEAATIIAGGSIIIRGGFLGGTDGIINAAGDLSCRLIEGGEVYVLGNLETTYIVNSKVKCGGAINLTGRGLVRGGHVSARLSLTANTLGSSQPLSAKTVIEVGVDPGFIEDYEWVKANVERLAKDISEFEMMITSIEKRESSENFTPEEINAHILKLQLSYQGAKEHLITFEKQVPQFLRATVNVRRTAHAELKIIIGNMQMTLQSSINAVSFYRDADGISFIPFRDYS